MHCLPRECHAVRSLALISDFYCEELVVSSAIQNIVHHPPLQGTGPSIVNDHRTKPTTHAQRTLHECT
jgi:hypothetical protein